MKKTKAPNPDKPLTDAEMNSGEWLQGIDGLPVDAQKAIRKMMGRPKSAKPKKIISFRFDSDIITHLKDCVSGYNTKVENMLREAIAQGKL